MKLSAEVLEAWGQMLARTPGSELVLYPFGPNWYQGKQAHRYVFLNRVHDVFAAFGVGLQDSCPTSHATNRYLPRQLPILRYNVVDRCHAPETPSDRLRGQFAEGVRASGLGALVAATRDEYVEKAVQLATSRELRESCSRMAAKCLPYFDDGLYAGRLDRILQGLVKVPALCW